MDNIVVHKKKRFFNKLKQNIERFLIYVFALIGMLATLNFAINTFREAGEWYFNKPVGIVAPAVVHAESVGSSSVNSEDREEETPLSPPLEIVLDKIYQLESSSGKNDTCEPKGHNGYGYGQHKTGNLCFDSDDEARQAVKAWFEKKEGSLAEKICLYNTGVKQESCPYLDKFNSI